MPFKPGKSGNPRGRPRGRKSAAAVLRDRLAQTLHDAAPELLETLRDRALAGDPFALRFLLERLIPPAKSSAQPVELPALATAGTLTEKADAVLAAVGAGELAPDVGAQLVGAVAAAARVAEIAELAARLAALERALSARRENSK